MTVIKYSGRIIEVIEEKHGKKTFEIARRSPGVRALIVKDGKILISREFRTEVGEYDYRLPGGKVFDSLEEYRLHSNENIDGFAKEAVIKECYEEVGLKVKNPQLIKVSKAGATIKWDLYYFLIEDFEIDKQHLEDGEDISFDWYDFNQVKQLCLDGKVQEDRSLAVILKFLILQERKWNSENARTERQVQ